MFVDTLVVFVCTTSLEFLNILDETAKMPFHRYFILPDDSVKNANLTIKATDSFMYFKVSEIDYAMIQRLVVSYSNPAYEKIIIYKENKNINFFSISNYFSESNYFDKDECIGFTRKHFVLNGQQIVKPETKTEVNDYEFIENISLALDGNPVSKSTFMLALEEILPLCKIDFSRSAAQLEKDITNFISTKNHHSSSTVYQVYYKELPTDLRNKIIFTHDELDVYSYVVRRNDGLNCFII